MKKDIKTGKIGLDKSYLDPKKAKLHMKITLTGDVYQTLMDKTTPEKDLSVVINETLRKALKKK